MKADIVNRREDFVILHLTLAEVALVLEVELADAFLPQFSNLLRNLT